MSDATRADYAQLQREYRNMELNRKAYADESNQVGDAPAALESAERARQDQQPC